VPLATLDGHFRRKDFSRWITGVFGDYGLGNAVSGIEDQYCAGDVAEVAENLVREVRSRYDFVHH
jgi:hypothetical protein